MSMKRLVYRILFILQFDRIVDFILQARTQVRLVRYKKQGLNINFVPQGGHELMIAGDLSRFQIHPTSHLKSDTFIECSGGVTIGRYFHVGRGLTIFSVSHDYKEAARIPYDEGIISEPVVIGDFVWCGANVTILPGICVGEGAILAAGSVVTKDVLPCGIVGGNPAKVIGYRDIARFEELKARDQFY